MGVFSLFSKRSGFDPDLFEKELADLTDQIGKTQLQITALSRSARAYRLSCIQYSVVLYTAVLTWLYSLSPGRQSEYGSSLAAFVMLLDKYRWSFIIIFPVATFVVSFLMGRAFDMLISKRKSSLMILKKKHHAKIAELKDITNFNKTTRLLLKFGDERLSPKLDQKLQTRPQSQHKQQLHPQQQPKQQTQQQQFGGNQPPNISNLTPRQQQEIAKLNLSFVNGQNPSLTQMPKGVSLGISQNKGTVPPSVRAKELPQHKTVLDRILDLLIGSSGSEAVEDRYALICNMCFTHNGLAPPNTVDPSLVKYTCRKCGFMNGVKLWEQINRSNSDSHTLEHASQQKGEPCTPDESDAHGNTPNDTDPTSLLPSQSESTPANQKI